MNPTMISLEPPYGARDPRGMAALVDAIPDHIEQALARTDAAPWRLPSTSPDLVAVGGMGGSAIAAELTGALWADVLPRPWLVVRDYRWPACVGPGSLAVLSSNSGNTEETLALEAEAARRGVPRVGMSSGGALGQHLAAAGAHCQSLPSGMPPRAALFHAWVPMTRLPAALGWVGDPGADWREAATLTRARLAELAAPVPEAANPAKRLARACHGRFVCVYAANGPMAAVATRWRQQLNENAKLLGHSAAVPELNHNEIVGWQAPRELHRATAVVVLRDREDPAEAVRRLDLTAEYAARQGAAVHEIRTVGESRIARLASLVQFGDHTSLHLALLGGVDPTDITSIDEFKRRLAESSPPR
jgi:glucose/mannose-6-phosphate isomerase